MSFSQKHIIRNFNKAAALFDATAFLFSEVNARVIQRLDVIPLLPKRILDCGAGTGIGTQALLKKYKKAEVISFDLSTAMLNKAKKKKFWRQKNYFVCGNADKLPFATDSFDFVYSNLMLHWCDDIQTIFAEWQRVLKPNGLLMFTALGPDSCKELFGAVHTIKPDQFVQGFIDMHDLGDALLKNQLLDPVMDIENLQINYSNAEQLLKELRAVGGRNLHPKRLKNLFGKSYYLQLVAELNKIKTRDKKIPLSMEVIYGHAWAGDVNRSINKGSHIEVPVVSIIKRAN